MSVKPGDLAIQVKSASGNEGRICKVLGPMGERPFYDGEFWNGGDGFCWMVEYQRPVKTNYGDAMKICPVPDAWLRPVSGLPDEQHTEEHNKQEV